MVDTLFSGLAAGYGLAIPVGAVAVLMVEMAARTSLRTGTAAAMGAVTADGLYAIAAMIGGAALANLLPPISVPLRWVGALVLVVMSVRIVRRAFATHSSEDSTASPDAPANPDAPGRAFLIFLGLTALNPWPAIYFIALIFGRQGQESPDGGHAVLYVAAILLASASWQLLLATAGRVLGRILTGPRAKRITALVSGALIVALAAQLVITDS